MEKIEEDYFDLISKKTAALFSASCQMGALSVENNQTALDNMFGFGENYGIAFQIMDDLLDYLGDTDKLGKPTGNDLREGKVTLPLIHALDVAPEGRRENVLAILERGVESEKDVEYIVHFVSTYGGVEYAMNEVKKYTTRALDFLKEYPDSVAKNSLIELVNYSTSREK